MTRKMEKATIKEDPRRRLPSVAVMLEEKEVKRMAGDYSRSVVLDVLRDILSEYGKELSKGDPPPSKSDIIARVKERLFQSSVDRLRSVVNALGIVLHTGLGRSPLSREASAALSQLHSCCNLQIDMETGQRGKRNYVTEQLICRLTGAEAAMVVNNNAAATYLILKVFCQGKEVIVSRGQLIEIGGMIRRFQ